MGSNRTATLWGGHVEPPCLLDTLAHVARVRADAPAVVEGDQRLTYAELFAWATTVAGLLTERGLRRGDRVAIACPRGAAAVAAILATTMAGCAYVPLDLEYPRQRLEYMLRDSEAALVLHTGEAPDFASGIAAAEIPPPVGPDGSVAFIGVPQADGAHDPDLPIYVIYTSGSTGWPKGVALQHSCLDNVADWQARFSPRPDLNTAQFAPLNFDVSFQEIFGTLCGGGTLFIMPERLRREPIHLLAWLAEHRVERLFLPYVALQMLAVAAAVSSATDSLVLREINVAGEQLVCSGEVRAFVARLPGCRLVNHYGQSESAMVTAHVLADDPADWPLLAPIGRPLPGCELLIDQTDPNDPDVGELLVAGLPVSLGYLGQPELNQRRYQRFDPTPHGHTRFFRTGDLVRLVDDGVQFLTRIDDDVKLRGIRVNLAEVDAQLTALPAVASAVAVVIGEDGPRTLRAGVVLHETADGFDEQQALRQLRDVLPDVAVPLSVTVLDQLPHTPSGKVSRESVAELITADLAERRNRVSAR